MRNQRTLKNTFERGLVMNNSEFAGSANILTGSVNFRIISANDKEWVLQNVDGNVEVARLTEGFIPLGVGSYLGVAYIVSYNPDTSETEIGSFPAPDYAGGTNNLIEAYRPLQNYKAPGATDYGVFRAINFGFNLSRPVQIEVQPTFDGSVNLIIQDGQQPEVLVNTRFSVREDNTFEIVDRQGVDSNLYDQNSFGTTLGLRQRSSYLMGVTFEGVELGGRVPTGNWRFYVKYSTQDGNETDVVAETKNIPVFIGTTPATVRSAKTGEPSDKQIKVRFTNLDPAFPFLRIYAAHASGEDDNTTLFYALRELYQVRGSELQFIFSGFEEKTSVSEGSLTLGNVSIDHFRAEAQLDNRLVMAFPTEPDRDMTMFQDFAHHVTLGHEEVKVQAAGGANPQHLLGQLYVENILAKNTLPGTVGFNGGYFNPHNVYHHLGEWGGEAVGYGMSFVYPDNTETAVYPVIGIDNLNGTKSVNTLDWDFFKTLSKLLVNQNGWNTSSGLNTKGVYRFPNRNAIGVSPLIENGKLSVFGITMQIPPMARDVYRKVRKITIGVRFYRADRKPDVIAQGYLLPTVRALASETAYYDHQAPAMYDDNSVKYVPTVRGGLEAVAHYEPDHSAEPVSNLFPFWFFRKFDAANGGTPIIPENKYAFYSADALTAEGRFADKMNQNLGRELFIHGYVNTIGTAVVEGQVFGADNKVPSVYMVTNIQKETRIGRKSASVTWVLGSNGAFSPIGRFSSKITTLEGKRNSSSFLRIPANFSPYAGITINGNLSPVTPELILASDAEAGANYTGYLGGYSGSMYAKVGMVANIYAIAQRTTSQVADLHKNMANVRYTPISDRLYWDTSIAGATSSNSLESLLNPQRRITLFGGDCFISQTHHRIYTNEYSDAAKDQYKINTGPSIQLVHEANSNPMFRRPFTADASEAATKGYQRSFPTHYSHDPNNNNAPYDWDNKKNSWRMYRLPESTAYNQGYNKLNSDIVYVAEATDAPYRAMAFPNRIYVSESYNPSSFLNGYRMIMPLSYRDYNPELGAIVAIVTQGGKLVIVHEKGVSSIALSERVQVANDSSGGIFIQPGSVLPSVAMKDSDMYGSQWKFAVLATDNFVYGIDLQKAAIWARAGERQVTVISDLTIQGYLKEFLAFYRGKKLGILNSDLRIHFNTDTKEVHFQFYMRDPDTDVPGEFITDDKSFTLIYNEVLKTWQYSLSAKALMFFHGPDGSYAFPLRKDQGMIHKQEVRKLADGTANSCTFFGEQHECYLEFVVMDEGDIQRVFDNLAIIGNKVYPKWIEYRTQQDFVRQEIKHGQGILKDNAHYREGAMFIQIKIAGMKRLKDDYLKIRIGYDTNERIYIKHIETVYRENFT